MKITKAELVRKDLHLRCDCMGELDKTGSGQQDIVYGLDRPQLTAEKAIKEFVAMHKANCPACKEKPQGKVLTEFLNKEY